MDNVLYLLIGIIGACFGSLVTLLSWRIPRGEPIGYTRSRCARCKTLLAWQDLIPVLSWILHRQKCRHCQQSIHWRYPLTEVVCATLFVIIYHFYGISLLAFYFAMLSVILLTIIVIDFEHYIIPDSLQITLAILAIVFQVTAGNTALADIIASFFLAFGIGWMLHSGYKLLMKKNGLGMGDVKFITVAGLWLDIPHLVSFFFFAGIFGICTAILWRILGKGARFPFGPALAASLFLTLFFPQNFNLLILLQHIYL